MKFLVFFNLSALFLAFYHYTNFILLLLLSELSMGFSTTGLLNYFVNGFQLYYWLSAMLDEFSGYCMIIIMVFQLISSRTPIINIGTIISGSYYYRILLILPVP